MHRRLKIFLTMVFCLVGAVAQAASLPTKTSAAAGVALKVTPVSVSGPTWDFEVVLDTHSKELSDDLLNSAVLVTDTRATHSPTQWQGDAPGGHHRKGVLRFKPVTPQPRTIELQIRRPGEAVPRTFSWVLQ